MSAPPKHVAESGRRRERDAGPWVAALVVALAASVAAVVMHWRSSSAALIQGATLRLVGADGRPAADIAVMASWTTLHGVIPTTDFTLLGKSAADGTVNLSALRGKWAIGATFLLEVQLVGFDDDPVALTMDTAITLPPTGSVVLRVVDERGRPPRLRNQGASLQGARIHRYLPYDDRATIDFGPVVCRSALHLQARVDGLRLHPGKVDGTSLRARSDADSTILGPDEPGAVREVVCTIADDVPRLFAVVQDAAGRPMQAQFGLALRAGSFNCSAFTVATDDRGRLEFLLAYRPQGPAELSLRAPDGQHLVATAHPTAEGHLDAGTMRLQ